MPRTNKKACRGSGRPSGAVAGERCTDSSATPKPPSCAERIPARTIEVLAWAAHLQPCEAAVLWCMVELQPSDGTPFAITHAQVAAALGVPHGLSCYAVQSLCAKGLLEVVRRGSAGRANQYRVPPQVPSAPIFIPPVRITEGGAA
jgi:hypothetical protein